MSNTSPQKIPFVDLGWQHRQIEAEVAAGFADVLGRTAFIEGAEVAAFETAFADYCGTGHCLGVANGTDAIELALRAGGIGPGDEVILPTNSFVATAEAVVRAGAVAVMVDVDDRYLLLDPAAVTAAITPRTAAVIAVHLFGQLAPMTELMALCARHGLLLVEDAAQSQGARQGGVAMGNFGRVAATSFYPGKNLGAYGDGGAVLTNDAELAATVRCLRNHGSERKYVHSMIGMNSRLDTLQAVALNAKLARLESWNQLRRDAAARYEDLLGTVTGVRTPATAPGNVHVWHLYVTRVAERDRVLAAMEADGVGVGIHYPQPIHLQPAFAALGDHAPAPVAEAAAAELLSLPLFPGITAAQQERVVESLHKAVLA
ncbi:MAG: DegT/DnrJ/EryC1/StrS family aminotransferase [Acidimicrobiales bacterium]